MQTAMMKRSDSKLTPPPSPSSQLSHRSGTGMPLNVYAVANIFLKMRRSQERARPAHIVCESGAPRTHDVLADESAASEHKVPITQHDVYKCSGAVDTARLLWASRATLLEKAQQLGGNALVDEDWQCRITCLKHQRSENVYRVQIRYSASAVRSHKRDPRRPVAAEQAESVPGLMFILDRQ